MKLSVAMPAYNEEVNIEKTVRYCFSVLEDLDSDAEVVVTDDGSTDRTGSILTELSSEFSNLVLKKNEPNMGYGAALSKAISATSGDIVITMDSDGQFDITDIQELLPQFDESTDFLTGYRRAKKDSFLRVFADRVMNLMIRIMFGVPYKDTNCALKLLRGNLIRNLSLEARGFQLPTEIVLKGHALGLQVSEAPVDHKPRSGGQSGLATFRTAIQMFVFLVYLRNKIALHSSGIIGEL